MKRFFQSGEPFIWLTGSALALSLLMIAGLVVVILVNGLGFFWPSSLETFSFKDGSAVMGHVVGRETDDDGIETRLQLKVGNRDAYGLDFRWIDVADIKERRRQGGAVVFERIEWGDMFAFVEGVYDGEARLAGGGDEGWDTLQEVFEKTEALNGVIERLENDDIGAINNEIGRLRLEERRLLLRDSRPERIKAVEERRQALWEEYEGMADRLDSLRRENARYGVDMRLASGEIRRIRVADIVRSFRPNDIGVASKTAIYVSKVFEFIGGKPRESNTEGGIFPALFGTVMMVFLMTLAVVPFGVLAALYLREYAKQGRLVRAIRIAVNNLAGVPSIVFGMFGLGFFVYGVGGSIDRIFFPEALPTPTYGTGGILWASLTLALLTVPVVVVATEEALASVSQEVRAGSLALGSTKFQMIWRVVLPSALPGILTGVILATARGAGEVAPLMITGVVKLAPDLPLDGFWPFFHLERKFMHLGFHIYDVGFQSPNVEAARPMVYATTLLLLLIVLALNLTAIFLRNYLRKRYATSTF